MAANRPGDVPSVRFPAAEPPLPACEWLVCPTPAAYASYIDIGRSAEPEGEMAFEPAVDCPVCETTLAPDRTLEDHLCRNHTQEELARHLVRTHDTAGEAVRQPVLSEAGSGGRGHEFR